MEELAGLCHVVTSRIFALAGHPKAKRRYGWSYDEMERFITIIAFARAANPTPAISGERRMNQLYAVCQVAAAHTRRAERFSPIGTADGIVTGSDTGLWRQM
jgi:hypothetical protein